MPGPLTEKDLVEINKALADLQQAESEIKLAKQAGIDVTAQETSMKQHREQLLKLKQTYFPGR